MEYRIGRRLVLACLFLVTAGYAEAGPDAGEIKYDPIIISEKNQNRKENKLTFVSVESEGMHDPDYILGAGDVLEIVTWKDESLSKVVPILPDGNIHFPLVGQIAAAGKTVSILQKEVEESLGKYVSEPYINVSVQQVNSMLVYIIGKVNHPGRFALNADVNVLQALAMAGGLNTFADGGEIKIIRGKNGSQQILKFDYDEAAKGKDLSANIILRRGDVIVVP